MENSTYSRVLDAAETMVKRNGFNAFSYRDLSGAVGIKTSSIHYYFPSKDDLGAALVRRFEAMIKGALEEIEAANSDPRERLRQYFALFEANTPEEADQACICGMLASDYYTLALEVKTEVRKLFQTNEGWLAKVLQAGREAGTFRFEGAAEALASSMFSALQGAILAGRMFSEEKRVSQTLEVWLGALS